ncbi:WD40 repeat-like protein [Viridothelium virens]|uniref:WD40 repeat-like protein n=1 Tax=Viridothelium virens TaxID=1048519 RepID=A0A6A6GYP5_VIRVR|nr:WD40 repeat-like protein [Viridothelium virens]
MLKSRGGLGSNGQETFQEPTPPSHEEEDSPSDAESFDGLDDEVDPTEAELEKLVFGDSIGFRDEIRNFGQQNLDDEDAEGQDGQEEDDDEENELARLEDAELFFTDAGPASLTEKSLVPTLGSEGEESGPGQERLAWEDSDDERIMVSLATVPRLRKLRNYEGEDLISGKEYTRRLRRQYELLNPTPDWAKFSTSQPPPRKRRKSNPDASDSSSEYSSANESEINISNLHPTTAPLAELLRSTSELTRSSRSSHPHRSFRPSVLNIQRTRDISGPSPSAITALTFHPHLPILLSSGPSSTLSLHHVAPSAQPIPNPLLTSLHLRSTPLRTIAWDASPSRPPRIFLAARRRYFHVWDLAAGTLEQVTRVYGHAHEQRSMEVLKPSPCGRFVALLGSGRKGGGVVNFLDARSLQWVGQCRVESRGGVADFGWWRDGSGVCVLGRNGEVTEWDVEDGRVVGRWEDEGAVGVAVVALGGLDRKGDGELGGDRWVAVGSASGIVNVYDRRAWKGGKSKIENGGELEMRDGNGEEEEHVQPMPRRPKPTKMLDQLTTAIKFLTFNPDGQLLAMGSHVKADALRLVHLPSCTVYRNWPTAGTKLGRISAVAFGEVKTQEDGEENLYLSVANDQGRIRLWEIRA